jgi:hypothetical protein
MRHVLLITGVLLLWASDAMAAMENVRFALHRKDKFESKTLKICDNPGTPTEEPNYSPNYDQIPCEDYTVTGPISVGSTVYVVVGHTDPGGIVAASFGVDYNGSAGTGIDPDFTGWTACADGIGYPNAGTQGVFPAPEGGLRITWNLPNCGNQTVNGVVHAVVGAFYVYVYSSDVLRLTRNNNLQSGPELAVTGCLSGLTTDMSTVVGEEFIPQLLGRVQFGTGTEGYTPCGVVPSRPSTWGRIKTQFHQHD